MSWQCRNSTLCTVDGCTAKAEVEALREQVQVLTDRLQLNDMENAALRAGHFAQIQLEGQLAAMTKLWENEYRLRCEAQGSVVKDSLTTEPASLFREIYEVWAGSEGIPMPRTCPEAYLLGLLEQMVDIAKTGMIAAGEVKP